MFNPPKVGLVIGKRGSGKTTLCKEVLKINQCFVVYDVNWEYSAEEFGALRVYFFEDLKKLLLRREPRIVFRPKRAYGNTFEFFCATLWLYARDYMIVITQV